MGLQHQENAFERTPANIATAPACRRCGHVGRSPRTVSMAFWRNEGLIVIQDIPVMTCDGCQDEYLADTTILTLDRLRGEALTRDRMVKAMIVPVFQFATDAGT